MFPSNKLNLSFYLGIMVRIPTTLPRLAPNGVKLWEFRLVDQPHIASTSYKSDYYYQPLAIELPNIQPILSSSHQIWLSESKGLSAIDFFEHRTPRFFRIPCMLLEVLVDSFHVRYTLTAVELETLVELVG